MHVRFAMLAVVLVACGDDADALRLRWEGVFDPPELALRAARVEARILEGGCEGTIEVYRATLSRGAASAAVPELPPGTYGFELRARDTSCTWFAGGCEARTLPRDSGTVLVTLTPIPEELACTACLGGECILPDSGPRPDDGGPGTDAPIDGGGFDAGPPPAEAPPFYPWNGLATGAHEVVLRWSESPDATRYEVQIDDGCDPHDFVTACTFAGVAPREVPAPADRLTVAGLAGLTGVPAGRRYYWRVRACRDLACTAWSFTRWIDVGRFASDYDGDGRPELAVGAPGEGGSDVGRVHVYRTSALSFATTVASIASQANARFGSAVASGDVDGDGFGDLVVGSDLFDDGVANTGGAWLVFGSSSGLGGGRAAVQLVRDAAERGTGDRFGQSVAVIDDLDGDGWREIAVGAPESDAGGTDSGSVFLYEGSATAGSWRPTAVLTVAASDARLGFAVRDAGDVNGDGFTDLVAGAPFFDRSAEDDGQAFVVLGGPGGAGTQVPLGAASSSWDYFGFALAAGDFDGDGYSDVAVAAPYENVGAESDHGRVYVYRGGPGVPAPTRAADDVLNHGTTYGHFGWGLTAGRVDVDAHADLVIGAPAIDSSGVLDVGRATLFLGSPTLFASTPDDTWTPPSDGDAEYARSAAVIDLDADGTANAVIGAHQYDGTFSNQGRIVVFADGLTGDLASSAPSPTSGGWFGYALESSMGSESNLACVARPLRTCP